MVSAKWEVMGTNSFQRQDGVLQREEWGESECVTGFVFLAYLPPALKHTPTIHGRGTMGSFYLNESPSGRLEAPLTPKVLFVRYLAACTSGEEKELHWRGREEGSMGLLKWLNLLATLNWLPVFHLGGKKNSKQVTKSYFWLFEYPQGGRFLTFQKLFQIEA